MFIHVLWTIEEGVEKKKGEGEVCATLSPINRKEAEDIPVSHGKKKKIIGRGLGLTNRNMIHKRISKTE